MDSDRYNRSTERVENIDIDQTTWVADILRNRRRIQVLLELESVGEDGVSVSELADRLAERDFGEGFSSAERRKIFVGLYQTHIPTLNATEVVNVGSRDYVTRGGRYSEVLSALYRLQP